MKNEILITIIEEDFFFHLFQCLALNNNTA